jgi:hypothetical protein
MFILEKSPHLCSHPYRYIDTGSRVAASRTRVRPCSRGCHQIRSAKAGQGRRGKNFGVVRPAPSLQPSRRGRPRSPLKWLDGKAAGVDHGRERGSGMRPRGCYAPSWPQGCRLLRFGDPLETQKVLLGGDVSKTCPRILVRVARSASFAAEMGKSNRRSTRRPVSALKKYALAGASRRSRMAASLRLEIVEITSPISFRPETSSSPRL